MAEPSDLLPSMAWLVSLSGSPPCAWSESGARVRHSDEWAPVPQPPTAVHYGGIAGDAAHELLDLDSFEARLSFTLTTCICVAQPELSRSLPLDNLPVDALPEELTPAPAMHARLAEAVRRGLSSSAALLDTVYVALDAYGGHGLFAAVELPPMAFVGEYLGTLCRGTAAVASDPYVMSYPAAAGSLYLTAKDAGSLARFVNHAPRGAPANNCTCWAVFVDGAYHICVVTTRAVQAREQLAYDYGPDYWARRGAPSMADTSPGEPAPSPPPTLSSPPSQPPPPPAAPADAPPNTPITAPVVLTAGPIESPHTSLWLPAQSGYERSPLWGVHLFHLLDAAT